MTKPSDEPGEFVDTRDKLVASEQRVKELEDYIYASLKERK